MNTLKTLYYYQKHTIFCTSIVYIDKVINSPPPTSYKIKTGEQSNYFSFITNAPALRTMPQITQCNVRVNWIKIKWGWLIDKYLSACYRTSYIVTCYKLFNLRYRYGKVLFYSLTKFFDKNNIVNTMRYLLFKANDYATCCRIK